MLIVLNIIIILFLLAMIAIWATYGFFSAFLHLMIVITSGTIAFAVWEPLSYWLLGRMPVTAWGIGLLAPFILCIIVLRVVFDKYCKMNLKFPRLADQAGGAACGLGAGVLSAGMLLMGAGFLMPDKIMGYQPYQMVRNTVTDSEEGRLWPVTRVDQWAGSFFTMISAGSMRPWSDTPLKDYKSDIAARAQIHHLAGDPNQSKAAPPEAVELSHVHVIDADTFLEMVVFATLEPLVTDQIDLGAIDDAARQKELDTGTVVRDIYGGHLIDGILDEFARRQKAVDDGEVDRNEYTAATRPSAVFNLQAMSALNELFKVPERGTTGNTSTATPTPTPQPDDNAGGVRDGRGGRDRTQVGPGDSPGPEDAGGDPEDTTDNADSTDDDTPVPGSPMSDPRAFFDLVHEKQIQPTIDSVDQQLRSGGQVVIVDTQWFKDPPGAFDSDGWLRIAIPSVRLRALKTGDGPAEYQSLPPIGYSLEVDQNTGERIYVDLVGQGYSSAFAQNDKTKIGWVFIVPPGHTPFRFEVRQLGFDLAEPATATAAEAQANSPAVTFWSQVALVGVIDVKPERAPPEGIEIGNTGAVVALGERLPRTLSPNNATEINPNRADEPWTAESGSQNNILPNAGGGRNSTMRSVSVAGKRLIRVIVTADANEALLAAARQQAQAISVRDDKGAEHAPIGFVLLHDDNSMDVSLRPGRVITADRLPRVGTSDELTIYFEVPIGVNVVEFVVGDPDSAGIKFAQPINVTER